MAEAHQTPPNDSQRDKTKRSLLESSGKVFAERGYRDATIRAICRRAGANVSAVKYHFGDKQRLYIAALEYTLARSVERYPLELADDPSLAPLERLRVFIRLLLWRLLDPGKPAWHGRLVLRELMEPTAGFSVIADVVRWNVVERLDRIVAAILGPRVDADSRREIVYCILGQCSFYRHSKRCLERFDPDRVRMAGDIERLADRIYAFSKAAVTHLGDARMEANPAPSRTTGKRAKK